MCQEVLLFMQYRANAEDQIRMAANYAVQSQPLREYAATHVTFSRPLGINYMSLTGTSYSYLASLKVAMYNGQKTMNYNNGGIGQIQHIPVRQEIIMPQLETKREQLFGEIGKLRGNAIYAEMPLGYN
ncbi:MAG: hypothetical protein AABW52_04265 [Nanoarchaeota archaeon]